MNESKIIFFLFFFLSNVLIAQTEEIIPLEFDTSGYNDEEMYRPGSIPSDTIPSIQSEMNVGSLGSLSYNVPIEVIKGINEFQPNLALGYNSQTGNAQVGLGWNVVGLSVITQGGKNKEIDGITIGSQFDESDPYYLDGQRLLKITSTNFETEKYSKIKITKQTSGEFSFIIQYTDGKIAKYKQLVNGQHYIVLFIDALDNKIEYSYTVNNNIPVLNAISYGGDTVSTKFFINFIYRNRTFPTQLYRNGLVYKSTKILSEIQIKSSVFSQNNGVYRKYKLYYDLIQSGTVDRLVKIEIENEKGIALKPLKFKYNQSNSGRIKYSTSKLSYWPSSVRELGSIAVSDFFGNGNPYPIYELKDADSKYKLYNPKSGVIETYDKSRDYISGKVLRNNKISEADDLIGIQTTYIGTDTNPNTANNLIDRLTFNSRSLLTGENKQIVMDLKGGLILKTFSQEGFPPVEITIPVRDKEGREILSGDFNNDGLVDVFIVERSNLNRPEKIYFTEIGMINSGTVTPTQVICPNLNLNDKTEFYQLEFDGDGIPEIMVLYRDTGKYSLLKFNPLTKVFKLIPNQVNITLSYFNEKTPLIFGDFNGDGLTDFITPNKVYNIEGSSAAAELLKMETETLWWSQYTSTGKVFNNVRKNFTEQKLAYLATSQRNVIKRSSGWDKFWNGKPDKYQYTEYATSTILPLDFNNDGKTDLVSVRKFGKAIYDEDGNLGRTIIQNLNDFQHPHRHYANKIFFHEAKNHNSGDQVFANLPTTIDLDNNQISPLSLILNNVDFNRLNTYKNGILIHDPIEREDKIYLMDNDDFFEGQLREIDNGSPVIQKIEYKPMVYEHNNNRDDAYFIESTSFNYPYFVHKNVGTYYLVHKIHTVFNDKILTTEYRYQNGIQHLGGKGFLGFQKTFISDPYESFISDGKYEMKNLFEGHFWNINTYDPLLENSLISTTYGSLNENSVFSRSTFVNSRFNKSNNRYLILTTSENTIDYLQGITISKSYDYDLTADLLLKQVNTSYNGIGSSIEKFYYETESTNSGHYHFGRINKIENTVYKGSESFSTKNESSFFPNGKLKQTKKYGNNTLPVVTDYTYYPFGAINTQTVSAQGIEPVTTTFQYDQTNRFLKKLISHDNLETTFNVDIIGRVISETSPLGHTTSYKYDNWGNVKEITDFLGKKTIIKKDITPNELLGYYSVSTKRDGEAESIAIMDIFDRVIKIKTMSANSQWVVSETEYDIFGKKTRFSEPYFEGDIKLWNYIEYDEINRPVKQISFNGKIHTTCYEGLKVTVEDGHKKSSKWVDAMGNVVKHQDGGGEIFYKYYPNGSLKEVDYDGIITKIEIDGWGNKTKLIDPSAGTYQYEYDNVGRLTKEINPKQGYTQYIYDDNGRIITENTISNSENTNIIKNYSYDNTTKLPTEISGTYNGKTYKYITHYDDPYHRITGKTEETPEFIYQTRMTYDEYGRVDLTELKTTLNDPGYTSVAQVKNVYDGNGVLISQIDAQTSVNIWKTEDVNAQGLITLMRYGNGYALNTTYNSNNLSLKSIRHIKDSQPVIDIEYGYDVIKGILLERNNNIFDKKEIFLYDDLDRLLREKVNNVTVKEYTYDKRGRMSYNSEIGKYNYEEDNYKLNNIEFNSSGSAIAGDRGFAEIKYNSFKNPNEIILDGKDHISYEFSILKTRSASYFGSLDENITKRPIKKLYSADKAIEIIKEGDTTKVITYITGDPYSANYMKIDVLTGNSLTNTDKYYLHRDNQGTILAVTKADMEGKVVEKRYFDAWGNLEAAHTDSSNEVLLPDAMGWINGLIIDRGYTGHEHLTTVGLIHMNGRIYDPKLRRFMSPDNYVQDDTTQNLNRYCYVLNNPLIYTDTSGEFIQIAIAIGVAMVVNGIVNSQNNIPFWYGAGKAGTMGAIGGIISLGIGSAATSFTSTINQSIFQAGMHGVSGGFISELSGGQFLSGMAAGAVSSMVSSAVQHLSNSGYYLDGDPAQWSSFATNNPGLYKATMIAAGGLSGGISSSIAGGNFWKGVQQGVIISGLNHLAHDKYESIKKHKFDRQIDRTYGSMADESIPIEGMNLGTIYDMIETVPILNKWFNESKPTMEVNNNRSYATDGSSEALTFLNADNKSSYITYFRASFVTYRHLAHTMLHELGHAYFNHLGYRIDTYNQYGDYKSAAGSEIFAFRFAYKIGGIQYQFHPWYVINIARAGSAKNDQRFNY